ncbi:MAG: hypothetical protein A3H32_02475 [Betaproteobacteria bacterium RIFCSPLOWO2_02_FULL_63_19]|nr:MAG: hypothetical protein A3H32_02475 [Betaproteobacteria bacterium RIFCSPLOWO2_02_FULL_63_19]
MFATCLGAAVTIRLSPPRHPLLHFRPWRWFRRTRFRLCAVDHEDLADVLDGACAREFANPRKQFGALRPIMV